jgi:small GTP-binding protein
MLAANQCGNSIFRTATAHTVFPSNYTTVEMTRDGEKVELDLWDTAGQSDNDKWRPESYVGADLFMVCFCVVSPASHDSVRSKWLPEIAAHRPGVPFVLVGTKTDLRDDAETLERLRQRKLQIIDRAHGVADACDLGARAYVECSAITLNGLKHVFEEALHQAVQPIVAAAAPASVWTCALL